MRISIAICTKDRPELLKSCLASITASSLLPDELIIIDQSENNLTEHLVNSFSGSGFELRYSKSKTRGKAIGLNGLSTVATGELIGFTDDDCLVDPNWILEAKNHLFNHPDVSILTGKVIPSSVHSDKVYTPRFLKEHQIMAQGRVNPWEHGCAGGNMFVKREVFLHLRGFDGRFGPGAEFRSAMDGDFVYRAIKSGLKSLYSPQLIVYHQDWRNNEESWALIYNYAFGLGAFAAKHFKTGDFYPLCWIGLKFSKKFRRFLLGLLFIQKTRLLDGALQVSGMARGFTKMLLFGQTHKFIDF
ncbi:MAG: glycosyltransferase family 2 protein [Candidatus Tectomicrobia bacterium]|uniref:Glycosyltransferase family 2 protein n=1 Tax=Tectimicrobiota bacterium TaxID=2528274 RepID=A0A933GMP7_UNCTE|nr:glycosyltransferase family 2 protein [Candidatus Tectomicrobia bacterium]